MNDNGLGRGTPPGRGPGPDRTGVDSDITKVLPGSVGR